MAARPKFGSEAVNNMMVRKALYGLKSSGAEFSSFLTENLNTMGYRLSYSGPDL